VNGTAAGLAAVRLAARESVARHQPLRVVHAFAWPGYDTSYTGVPYDQLRHQADEVLAGAVTTALRSAPAAQVSGYVVDGAPTRVLLHLSRTAGLLVLGDDDPGATVRLFTDSVLVQTVARSRCPVLIARGAGTPDGPVVVGIDGSPSARLALRYAAAEAVRRRASLHVVHVRDIVDDCAEEDEATARHLLGSALTDAGLTRHGAAEADAEVPHDVWAELLTGDPATELIRAAARARVLVVGPNGTGSRFGALLGEVAQTVLRRSGCPTLFVHGVQGDQHPR
jgi:nucleotide-binding universal stress UspA family protein